MRGKPGAGALAFLQDGAAQGRGRAGAGPQQDGRKVQEQVQEQMAAVRAKEAASRASAAAAHEELQSKVPFCVR